MATWQPLRTCLGALAIAAATAAAATTPVAKAVAPTPSWLGDIPGLGDVAPDPTPPGAPVLMTGCTITNPLFMADRDRARRLVPSDYQLGANPYLGANVATVIVGVLFCSDVSIDDGHPTSTVLSVVAVQVRADPSGGSIPDVVWDLYNRSNLNLLPSSSWYLVTAQTDNENLARVLESAGLPADYDPAITYTSHYNRAAPKRDYLSTGAGGYRLSTTTLLPDPFVHNHDWFFWHDTAGTPTAFFLHLHGMADSSCAYNASPVVHLVAPVCGTTLDADPGGPVATLLGARTVQTTLAFNHPSSHSRGYITLPGTVR